MHRPGLALLLSTLILSGCVGVTFQFGDAPVALERTTAADRCIADQQLVVRPATAEYPTRQNVGGGVMITTTYRHEGVAFFKGSRRLSAEAALRELARPDLQAAYQARYRDELAVGRSRLRTGKITFGVGSALTVGGLAAMMASIPVRSDDRKGSAALLWTGLGMTLVGVVVAGVGVSYWGAGRRSANVGESHQQLFLSRELEGDLYRAIAEYNRRVAQQCGRPEGPQTLPPPGTPALPGTPLPPGPPPRKTPTPPPGQPETF